MASLPSPPDPLSDDDTALAVAPAKPALRRPSMWQVVMINDDYTPMDFVVMILAEVFDMGLDEAVQVMLTVHRAGRAVVGVYTREIAQAKQEQALGIAQAEAHPLRVELERTAGSSDPD